MKKLWSLLLLVMVSAAQGAKIPVTKNAVTKNLLNIDQGNSKGLASWYGRREQGKRQANGARFNRHLYTCASLHYKLGTLLLVKFPKKGTMITVKVTDRGPWIKGRILDLSEHAAEVLGLKPYGVGYVEAEPVRIF